MKPAAIVASVSDAGNSGVKVTWISGFPQIGDRLYTAAALEAHSRKIAELEAALRYADEELENVDFSVDGPTRTRIRAALAKP